MYIDCVKHLLNSLDSLDENSLHRNYKQILKLRKINTWLIKKYIQKKLKEA